MKKANKDSVSQLVLDAIDQNKDASHVRRRAMKQSVNILLNPSTEANAVFQHSVLCQTFLPYKNPGDDVRDIEKKQGRAILSLEAGKVFNPMTESLEKVGLPFGAKARLILSYINTQAVKTQKCEIDVEDSMTAFIKRIGLNSDGATIRLAKEQLKRLSAAKISIGFVIDEEMKRGMQTNFNLIQSFDIWFPEETKQRVAWSSVVKLSDDYFNSLINHAIPLDERALAALSNNALALDTYSWLAQRLHRVAKGKPEFVGWAAIKEQFGEGYSEMFKFKQKFRQTLQIVLPQYRDARIHEDTNKGFYLENSAPPIPPQQFHFLSGGLPKNKLKSEE